MVGPSLKKINLRTHLTYNLEPNYQHSRGPTKFHKHLRQTFFFFIFWRAKYFEAFILRQNLALGRWFEITFEVIFKLIKRTHGTATFTGWWNKDWTIWTLSYYTSLSFSWREKLLPGNQLIYFNKCWNG